MMSDTHLVLDTDFLEDLWMDDCKCESAHTYTPECEGKAAYQIGTKCGGKTLVNVCRPVIENPTNGTRIRMEHVYCVHCVQPASKCWTIRPI